MLILPVVGVLVETTASGEDDKSNLSATQDRELISFLEQTIASFAESDLAIRGVLYPLYLYLPSPYLLAALCYFITRTTLHLYQPYSLKINQTQSNTTHTLREIK